MYVAVTLKVDREGNVRPLSFEWEDGRVFAVDRVLSQGMAPARHVGAVTYGIRLFVCPRKSAGAFEINL